MTSIETNISKLQMIISNEEDTKAIKTIRSFDVIKNMFKNFCEEENISHIIDEATKKQVILENININGYSESSSCKRYKGNLERMNSFLDKEDLTYDDTIRFYKIADECERIYTRFKEDNY